MPKKIDLTGQRFGKLVVIKESSERKSGRVCWECQCDCGNTIVVKGLSLKNGDTKSCGCLRAGDEVGKQYGKWTVIERGPNLKRRVRWLCECECGTHALVLASNLRNGTSTSCGCQNKNDLIGQKFGKLTVVGENPIRKNEHVCWDCKCDCGNLTTVEGYNLKNGSTQSCGCQKQSVGEEHIENILKFNNINYIREYRVTIEDKQRRYDFALLDNDGIIKRLIEFDGIQHTPGWTRGFYTMERNLEIQQSDFEKNDYAIKHHIPLVRIPYTLRDIMTLEDLIGDKYLVSNA